MTVIEVIRVAKVKQQNGELFKMKKEVDKRRDIEEKAWVYRSNGSIEVVEGFSGKKLNGEQILPGFELDLEEFKVPA